jgi:dihydropteroate synthase
MTSAIARLLPADGRAAVMGILNITPDSFSDGGQFYRAGSFDEGALLQHAEAMMAAGVDLFDIGGESTRPGAAPVSSAEELARVVPIVKLLKERFAVPVSVDTSNPDVIKAAADAGADMINDVRALTRPGALEAAVASQLPVCLMHMPAEPDRMQDNPHYGDVVADVLEYLLHRVAAVEDAGIDRESIAIDPGFGFGKTLAHNLALFRALPQFVVTGLPVLVGVSRKRMVGELLGHEKPADRVIGSVALALMAAQAGARIIRVHDVMETVDAIKILNSV